MKIFNKPAKLISLITLFFLFSFNAIAQNSVIGKWKSIDDKTNTPRSILEIFDAGNGTLGARVVKIFKKPGEEGIPKCIKCKDERKDQPILGMQIMSGLKKESDTEWADGKILDPENGKTYSCKIELIENGTKLKVRGFLGVSLFGRSQIWERETSN